MIKLRFNIDFFLSGFILFLVGLVVCYGVLNYVIDKYPNDIWFHVVVVMVGGATLIIGFVLMLCLGSVNINDWIRRNQ